MIKLLILPLFSILLLGCSSIAEPNGLLGVEFGTSYKEVQVSMEQKGFQKYFESPNEKGIVYNNGKCFGYDVDVVFMNMDDSKKLSQCIATFDINIINELSAAIIDKYKTHPKIESGNNTTVYVWVFSTCELRLANNGSQTIFMATNKANGNDIKSDL